MARRRLNTVREVCQEFIDRAIAGRVTDGWKTRQVILVKFIAAKGDVTLDDLIADDLEKWIEEHPAWDSGWTKKRVAQTVKCAFSWAWNKGLTGCHPLKGVSYKGGERGKPMTEAQFRAILREVGAEYRRVLFFLWWTGCRPAELCALKWAYIDVQNSTAVLREHKTAHSREDGAPRTIYLSEQAVRLLTWILADQSPDQEYVFLNRWGNRWSRGAVTRRLTMLRDRLGLAPTVKVYGCRHSFGTRMILAGNELKTVATLMGHSNTLMTEHYIHMAGETEHVHNALEKGLSHKKKETP